MKTNKTNHLNEMASYKQRMGPICLNIDVSCKRKEYLALFYFY